MQLAVVLPQALQCRADGMGTRTGRDGNSKRSPVGRRGQQTQEGLASWAKSVDRRPGMAAEARSRPPTFPSPRGAEHVEAEGMSGQRQSHH